MGNRARFPDLQIPKRTEPLDTARLKAVLQLAGEKAEWGMPAAAGSPAVAGKQLPKGVARGIAGYYSFESYTAAVAEVSVDKGKVRVHRIVYAVDCGRPVNPSGVVAQVESAAVYALSAVMKDAITIDRGRVQQANFNDYDMPRMSEMPKIEVHLVMSK